MLELDFLLDKLLPIFYNEVQQFGGVHEEVVYMRGQLDYLRAFLSDADRLEESDEELRVWVRQVREVAHDAEDILDEHKLLQPHEFGGGIHGALCRLSCCIREVKARYRIASELRAINARIRAICETHKRLSHKFLRLEQDWDSGESSSWKDRRSTALLLEKTEVVGFEESKNDVVARLIGGSSGREIVSLLGMGGMGKTTLAKQVYDDEKVAKHFKLRAWLSISKPFKLVLLLRDMVRELHGAFKRRVPGDVDKMNCDKLMGMVKHLLRRHKYLVILDDVWEPSAWSILKHVFPDNDYGSRVLLTTRNADVASMTTVKSKGKVYELKPLPKEQSWDLFCRKTFPGNTCPTHLEEICAGILRKCEGMPLAIVAIGGVLATKDTRRIDQWDTILRSLGAEISGNDQLQDLRKVLLLSFHDLPYYLKSCFLYLSIFPEHHEIEHKRLTRLWIAEGFVAAKEGKEPEDVAEDYARELLSRSLIQVATTTPDGRVKTFRIHDLLREIIVSKSREQNFAVAFRDQNQLGLEKVRRLSIQNTLQDLPQNISASQMRSLFMFGVTEKFSLAGLFPHGIKLCNVIDLGNGPLEKFPVELCYFRHMKYLSLRNTKVNSVPRSIGNLTNLETLDLKYCYVTELPVEIQKLQKLRHLLVYRYVFKAYGDFQNNFGFKTRANIGLLQSLQKVCSIDADEGGDTLIAELGKLIHLRRLGITKFKRDYGRSMCATIERLTSLRSLFLESREEDEVIDLQHLSSPPLLLQRLYLGGKLETLPHWIPSLYCLVRLHLNWSKLEDDPLPYLQQLPNLVHLRLCQAFYGEKLCFRASGFKKLKLLDLDTFEGLRCIELEVGTLPVLEKFFLQSCELLEMIPSGIEHLTKLKILEFFNMSGHLIGTLLDDENASDHWKIANIPQVYFTYGTEEGLEVYTLEGFLREKMYLDQSLPSRSRNLKLIGNSHYLPWFQWRSSCCL